MQIFAWRKSDRMQDKIKMTPALLDCCKHSPSCLSSRTSQGNSIFRTELIGQRFDIGLRLFIQVRNSADPRAEATNVVAQPHAIELSFAIPTR